MKKFYTIIIAFVFTLAANAQISVSSEPQLVNAINSAPVSTPTTIILQNDITITARIEIAAWKEITITSIGEAKAIKMGFTGTGTAGYHFRVVDNVNLTFENVVIDCASKAGGIRPEGANTTITLSNTIVKNCLRNDSWGLIENNSNISLIIDHSTFINNSSGYGIVYSTAGTVTINYSTFSNSSGGSNIVTSSGNLTVSNSSFFNNINVNRVINSSGMATTISNSTFADNTTNYGVFNSGNNILIENSSFSNNITRYGGSTFSFYGNATVTHSSFINNRNTSTSTYDLCSGAIYVLSGGSLTINNSIISGNSTQSFGGGGILAIGSVTIGDNVSIIGNSAPNGNGGGIFMYNLNNLTVLPSAQVTFFGNFAKTAGYLSECQDAAIYDPETVISPFYSVPISVSALKNFTSTEKIPYTTLSHPSFTSPYNNYDVNFVCSTPCNELIEVCAGIIELEDFINYADTGSELKFYDKDKLLLTTPPVILTPGAYTFYAQAILNDCVGDMEPFSIEVKMCSSNIDVLACLESTDIDLLQFHPEIPDCTSLTFTAIAKKGTVAGATNNGIIYEYYDVGMDTLIYEIKCDGASTKGVLFIFVKECPDNIVVVDCYENPPAIVFGIKEIHRSPAGDMVSGVTTPVVGDIDDDGEVEILVMNNTDHGSSSHNAIYIYGIDKLTNNLYRKYTIPVNQPGGSFPYDPIAIAKVDGNQYASIFYASVHEKALYKYDFDGTTWTLTGGNYYTTNDNYSPVSPAITDIMGNGRTQVVVLDKIYDTKTFNLIADGGFITGSSGTSAYSFGRFGHASYSTHDFQSSVVPMDIDGDGIMEIIGGDCVYGVHLEDFDNLHPNNTFTLKMRADNTSHPEIGDGGTALADIDNCGQVEVVVVGPVANGFRTSKFGTIYIYNPRTGAVLHSNSITDIPRATTYPPSEFFVYGPSRPLIGDFDRDGYPEIALTGCRVMNCYKFNMATKELDLKWSEVTTDESASTGMTVFDFAHDGKDRIIYRDEQQLRIIDASGDYPVIEATFHNVESATVNEYVIVADINGDDAAEIILVGDREYAANCNNGGGCHHDGQLIIYASSTKPWAPARKVWNQSAYYALNVNEDLTIPQHPMSMARLFPGFDGVLGTADDVRPFNGFLMQQTLLNQNGTPLWKAADIKWCQEPAMTVAGDSIVFTGCIKNVGDAALITPIFITFYKNDTIPANIPNNIMKYDSINYTLMKDSSYTFRIVIHNISQYAPVDTIWFSVNDKNGDYPYQVQCAVDGRRGFVAFIKQKNINKQVLTCWPTETIDVISEVLAGKAIDCDLSNIFIKISEPLVPGATAVLDANKNIVYTRLPGPDVTYRDTICYTFSCVGKDTIYAGKIFIQVFPCPDNIDEVDCYGDPSPFEWAIKEEFRSTTTGDHNYAIPLVADIDGDGIPEIITVRSYTSPATYSQGFNIYLGKDRQDGKTTPKIVTVPNGVRVLDIGTNVMPAICKAVVGAVQKNIIVLVSGNGTLLEAYDLNDAIINNNQTGRHLWRTTIPVFNNTSIGIADFDNCGNPEIYIAGNIYDAATGFLLVNGGNLDILYLGSSIAADINNDGKLELIAGTSVYAVDIPNRAGSSGNTSTLPGNSLTLIKKLSENINFSDGATVGAFSYTCVADINQDGKLDIIISFTQTASANTNQYVKIVAWDFESNSILCSYEFTHGLGGGYGTTIGPMMIGNIDDDPELEVVFISGWLRNNVFLNALKPDFATKTFRKAYEFSEADGIIDRSSACTGMTLFDFNYDGQSEIVYRDEQHLWVLTAMPPAIPGGVGSFDVRFKKPCTSGTVAEYPVIADVDNDGAAEIVVVGNTVVDVSGAGYLWIFKSGNQFPWAPARKVWNQHNYNVLNVNEDLTIPRYQMNPARFFAGKSGLYDIQPFNNFLQQQTLLNQDGVPFVPMANIKWVSGPVFGGTPFSSTVSGCIENVGSVAVQTPIYVTFYKNDTIIPPGSIIKVDSIVGALMPGASRCFTLTIDRLDTITNLETLWVSINDKGTGKYPYQDQCELNGRRPIDMYCPPVSIRSTYVKTHPSCSNSDGCIVFFPFGGSDPGAYEYRILSAYSSLLTPYTPYTDSIVCGLSSGVYIIQLLDTNHRICPPAQEEIRLIDTTDLKIFADPFNTTTCATSNGGIFVATSGGKRPYTYTLEKLDGELFTEVTPFTIENDTIKNLGAGSYIVTVTDGSDCKVYSYPPIRIGAADGELQLAKLLTVPTACDRDTGSVTFSITTDSHYWYQLNGSAMTGPLPASVTTITLENLNAGSHFILAYNECGGKDTLRFTIDLDEPGPLSAVAVPTNMKKYCEGNFALGSIYLEINGGIPPYRYTYAAGDTVDVTTNPLTIPNLINGKYDITVLDATVCRYDVSNVIIAIEEIEPVKVSSIYAGNHPSGCGACDGSIIFFPEGGSGNYLYTLVPAVVPPFYVQVQYQDSLIRNLCAGSYTVEVMDAAYPACPVAVSSNIILRDISNLFAALTPISAPSCDGTGELLVTVTGGVPPFTYKVYESPRVTGASAVVTTTSLANGNKITALPVGTYEVDVIDNNGTGCTFTAGPATITADASDLEIALLSVRPTPCNEEKGVVTFTITSSLTYTFKLNDGEEKIVTRPPLSGIITDTHSFINLKAGSHVVTVVTACASKTLRFPIANSNSNLSATAVPTNVKQLCDGETQLGSILLMVNEGLPGYRYTYREGDTVSFSSSHVIIPNLTEGTYYITQIDATGCTYILNKIDIRTECATPVSIGTVKAGTYPTCNSANGTIIIYLEGGSGDYLYNVYRDSHLLASHTLLSYNNATHTISDLPAGTYRIEVYDAERPDCVPAVSDHIALYNNVSPLSIYVVPTPANDCDSNGSLFVEVRGGSGKYTYTLNGSPVVVTGGKIENLPVGPYIVEVIDAGSAVAPVFPACSATSDEVWINPKIEDISITQLDIEHTTCGKRNGWISFEFTGSKEFYYQLHGSSIEGPITGTAPITNSAVFTDLPAGDYTLRAFGCGEVIRHFTIKNTDNALNFAAAPHNVTVYCTGDTKAGYIALDILAGTATHYRIDGGTWIPLAGAKDTIKNLKEGTYTIEIKNHTNCIVKNDAVRIERAPSILSLGTIAVVSQPTCMLNDGVIMFYPTGGSGLYDYRIMNQVDGNYINAWTAYTGVPHTNIVIGAYRVEIRDRIYNCGTVLSPEVNLRDSLNRLKVELIPTDAGDCTVKDGTLTAVISNYDATPPNNYTYVLYKDGVAQNPSGSSFPADGKIPVPASPPLSQGYGFPAGEYQIMVWHNIPNCFALSDRVRINSLSSDDIFSIQILDSLCATCPQNNNGLVQYKIKGTPPYKLQFDIEQVITINTSNDTIIVRTGLDAGDHFLHIWGKCGEASKRFTIPVCGGVGSSLYALLDTIHPVRELITGVIVRGQIDFKIFGGSPTYKYTITGGVNEVVLTGTTNGDMVHIPGLLEGIYKVEAEDATGCKYTMYVLITRFIEVDDLLDCAAMIDRRVTEKDCNAGYTLTATDNWDVAYNIAISLDSIRYIVDDVIYSSGKTSSLVGYKFDAGVSNVVVVGYLGTLTDTCRFEVEVVPVTPIGIGSIYVGNHPTCGIDDGCIILSVSGGKPGSYSYSFNGLDYYPYQDTICGLYAGNYTVKVTGSTNYNCPIAVSETITLTDSTGLLMKVVPVDATQCGVANGEINVTVTGGTPTDFRYFKLPDVVTPLPILPANKANGLSVGEYVVEVTYGGCKMLSNPLRICAPDSDLEIEELNIIHTDCGIDAGEYWFTVVTASEYRYRFGSTEYGPFNVTFDKDTVYLKDLNAGTYMVTVWTDCGIDTLRFTINNSIGFSATAVPTNVKIHCAGNITLGNIELTVTNGASSYRYSYDEGKTWTNFSGPTVTIPNLTEGFYYIRIMDDDDCSFYINYIEIRVERSLPLHLTSVFAATHPTCTSKGSIKVNVTGGSGEYEYNYGKGWNTLSVSGIITGFDAGSYNISIRDKNTTDCPAVTSGDIILHNAPGQLAVLLTATQSATCDIHTGTGVLTVTVLNGSGSGSYKLSDGNTGTYSTPIFFITNKPVGEYTIEITDDGCVAGSAKVRISSDDFTLAISPITIARNPDCGVTEGTASFTISGVTGTAYYQLNNEAPVEFVSNPVILSGLASGVHTLLVYDDCGKIDSTFTITTMGSTLAFTPTVTDELADCDDIVNIGNIEFVIEPGIPDYQYRIDGGIWIDITGNTASFPASSGLYTIEVKDDEGCTFEIPRIRVDREEEVCNLFDCTLITDKTVTENDCNAGYLVNTEWDADFATIATVDSIRYIVNDVIYSSGKTASLSGYIFEVGVSKVIVVGYKKSVTDTCEFEVTVLPVTPITIGTIHVQNYPTCGNADGCVVLYAKGGISSSYRYTLDGVNYYPLQDTICGLKAGTYRIEIVGSTLYNCPVSVSETITLSDIISDFTIKVETKDATSCGANDGELTVTVTGGLPTDYKYYKLPDLTTPLPIPSSYHPTGLSVGEYVVSATIGTCKVFSNPVKISAPDSDLEIRRLKTIHTDCGVDKGEFWFTVATASAYKYRFGSNEYGPSNVTFGKDTVCLTDLSAGNYLVTVVTDCGIDSLHFTINNSKGFSAKETHTHVKVYCDEFVVLGTINLTITGGASPYWYSYDNGKTWTQFSGSTVTIPNLKEGYYYLLIKDNEDCIIKMDYINIRVERITPPTLTSVFAATHPSCTDKGSIQVYISGGTGDYEYSINGGVTYKTLAANGIIPNLNSGGYYIYLRDANAPACLPLVSGEIRLFNPPGQLAVSATTAPSYSCNPSSGNGTITVTVQNGSGSGFYRVNGGAEIPYTSSTFTITNKPVGEYVIEVREGACIAGSEKIRITSTSSSLAISAITVTNATECGYVNGTATFSISGITGTAWYQVDNNRAVKITKSPITISDLGAGVHSLRVFDGCGEKTANFTISTQGSTLSFRPTVTDENGDCEGLFTTGNININITAGIPPYQYRIDGGNWLDISGNEVGFAASAGLYTVEVIDDGGCTFVITRIRVDRKNDICDLLDCTLLPNRYAAEDSPASCRYTHSGTDWDVVPVTPLDSIHYYINGTLASTGATLDGAIFPVGVSQVTVTAYYRKAVSTCSFTVFVERVCPNSVDDTDPVPHTYTVTKVAGLCWTSNLRAKEYSDGSAIAFAKPYYHPLYPDVAHHDSIFGLLYTWYSAVGVTPEGANTLPVPNVNGFVQGICPDGYHIPTQAEFKQLEMWSAKDLKSTDYWIVPGTNLSDFDSRGAGKYSAVVGRFVDLYGFTGYWASDAGSGHNAPYISLTYYYDICGFAEEQTSKLDGLSVRCVWDGTECE